MPGPGESSTPSKASASSGRTASFRRTSHSAPNWYRYWTKLNTKLS